MTKPIKRTIRCTECGAGPCRYAASLGYTIVKRNPAAVGKDACLVAKVEERA